MNTSLIFSLFFFSNQQFRNPVLSGAKTRLISPRLTLGSIRCVVKVLPLSPREEIFSTVGYSRVLHGQVHARDPAALLQHIDCSKRCTGTVNEAFLVLYRPVTSGDGQARKEQFCIVGFSSIHLYRPGLCSIINPLPSGKLDFTCFEHWR